jgi:branched-chain amino acid transport system substrate-binding protein
MAQGAQTLPPMVWTIGVDLPLSGPGAYLGQPVRNAVQLAVDDFNESGGLDGSTLTLEVLDDAQDPQQGAENAEAFVSDPTTIAMIGPWGSAVSFGVIPITNEAGLLECSPASTHPGLTKPRDGALDLRSARPEAINFFRLAPADDIQAVALASFAYHNLGARFALVIDDTGVGRVIADPFEDEFKELGGTTLRRALNPSAEPRSLLAQLADELNPPDLVFFGGETDTGAVALRRAMAEAGRLSTPLLSWDFLFDGDGSDPGSYIGQTGAEAAVGSYVAHAALPDTKASFADAYRQEFETEPDEYAAAGYACVEIIIAAMRGIAASGPSAAEVGERLRAYVADPEHRFETVLGTVGFDANGDALQQFVTFYRVEASAANGTGDWVIFKKQDFGPAP